MNKVERPGAVKVNAKETGRPVNVNAGQIGRLMPST